MKNRIRELRLEKGLRQKDVAEKLGISAQSLGYYENWINKPDPEMLIKLSDFFEVSVDYLLCREDESGIISARGENNISEEEEKLIQIYHTLSPSMKDFALHMLEFLKQSNK